MIEEITARVNADTALVRRGRFVSLDFLVGVGEADYIVSVREGHIAGVENRRVQTHTGRFSVRASSDVWAEHWKLMPQRGRHDLFSMVAAGLAEFDGDLLPLMQNLQYFKDVLSSPRPVAAEG
jgi:hypothetical protein